jgi:hypothetical protein
MIRGGEKPDLIFTVIEYLFYVFFEGYQSGCVRTNEVVRKFGFLLSERVFQHSPAVDIFNLASAADGGNFDYLNVNFYEVNGDFPNSYGSGLARHHYGNLFNVRINTLTPLNVLLFRSFGLIVTTSGVWNVKNNEYPFGRKDAFDTGQLVNLEYQQQLEALSYVPIPVKTGGGVQLRSDKRLFCDLFSPRVEEVEESNLFTHLAPMFKLFSPNQFPQYQRINIKSRPSQFCLMNSGTVGFMREDHPHKKTI